MPFGHATMTVLGKLPCFSCRHRGEGGGILANETAVNSRRHLKFPRNPKILTDKFVGGMSKSAKFLKHFPIKSVSLFEKFSVQYFGSLF